LFNLISKKSSFFQKRKSGFTLIEIAVAIFIFTTVLVIGAASGNFNFGNTRAHRNKAIVDSTKNVFDTLNQKIMNANAKVTIGGQVVYGFRIFNGTTPSDTNGNMIIIASNDPSGTVCTYVGLNGNTIGMKQDTCLAIPALSALDKPLTSSDTKVNSFVLNGSSINNSPSQIPFVKVTITGENTNESVNVINMQTIYTLDLDTVKRLKSL